MTEEQTLELSRSQSVFELTEDDEWRATLIECMEAMDRELAEENESERD